MRVVEYRFIFFLVCLIGNATHAQVEEEQINIVSSFDTISVLDSSALNKYFREVNPIEMTFKPTMVIDSANWILLTEYAILDLDMGDVEITENEKYYGIGRYNSNRITYYFVAMPLPEGGWGISVFACNDTGKFTDAYMIAFGIQNYDEEIYKYDQYAWIEEVKHSNELIFVTRSKESYRNHADEENYELIVNDCRAICLREGEFAPFNKGNVQAWNKKYMLNFDKAE